MGRHRFLKEVCSFDGAFQVYSVEPGQDCKRALVIVQGICTYMRAEDIEVSNLLDIEISMGVCLLICLGSRTSRMPTATPSLTLFDLRRHTQVLAT